MQHNSHTVASDDQEFEHAVAHAQMMWRLSYKQECQRRHADMDRNEAQANQSLADGIKQDRMDEQRYQVKRANDAEFERKQTANDKFWSRVLFVCNILAVFIVAVGLYRIFKG